MCRARGEATIIIKTVAASVTLPRRRTGHGGGSGETFRSRWVQISAERQRWAPGTLGTEAARFSSTWWHKRESMHLNGTRKTSCLQKKKSLPSSVAVICNNNNNNDISAWLHTKKKLLQWLIIKSKLEVLVSTLLRWWPSSIQQTSFLPPFWCENWLHLHVNCLC